MSLKKTKNFGFTLVDILIYILFVSTIVVVLFSIFQNITRQSERITKEYEFRNEISFVVQKINRIIKTSSEILINKSNFKDGNIVLFDKETVPPKEIEITYNENSKNILVNRNNSEDIPITSDNLQINQLIFEQNEPYLLEYKLNFQIPGEDKSVDEINSAIYLNQSNEIY